MTVQESRPRLLRRTGDSEVAPIELFFDLVYVFAIVQVSHTLLYHLTPLGALETALLFTAVWWLWNYSAWAMNYLDPARTPVRVLNALLMLAALGMALALPSAFAGGGLLFALCFAAAQIGRPLFMWIAMRGHVLSRNYRNLLVWSAAASVLFLVGAFLPPVARLVVWAVAVAVDLAGPRFEFRVPGLGSTPMTDWPVDVEHLAERNRLVFIIALGESILIMGFTLSEMAEITPYTVLITLLGFTGLVALWWSYFALAGHGTAASRGDDSTRAARSAFAYAHGLMVAGAVLFAVAIDLHLTHPENTPSLVLTSIGGPLLYLVGNKIYLRGRTGTVGASRYVAGAVLIVAGAVALLLGHALPAIAIGLVVLAVVVGLAVVTQLSGGRAEPV
ncbi:putative transmembrane protein [Pseudonocardia sp. Ae168_Ps1]|uniref:low temperature requirement protein A n=1 Tax=unclassified Pseudonocardia TaxID=2619320 RepID=UPI00094B447C|nr:MULTISPECIES: low temperature requirement protein A [unclassified Pseudonocardia]OLL73361.1 putative transmembrane protein [Pseudonocardia sp. Ae150A_Ps1]OLL79336.1 putative transmembrane protein [Pseudonocardia sp. Ae168_Ps1]OLL86529.1 putative transmembrane protein [Pseudonocardia sp. Ae263_Ps1]OLL93423.1 putative transmembrane protein [Pseudonocardia sp. Ae356_Ps1]